MLKKRSISKTIVSFLVFLSPLTKQSVFYEKLTWPISSAKVQNCAELLGNYRSRNCEQVKSTSVRNPNVQGVPSSHGNFEKT